MIARYPGQVAAISGAVEHDGLVYTSGLVAPSVLAGASPGVAEQAEEVLGLLGAVLIQAGADFSTVLRLEAYLAGPSGLPAWNAAFTQIWPAAAPARTTVVVTLALPGALIEIQAVAAVSPGGDHRLLGTAP